MKEQCPQCLKYFVALENGGLRAHGPVHARCQQDPELSELKRSCAGCGMVMVLLKNEPFPPHGPTPGVTCTQQAPVSDPAPTVESMEDTPVPADHQPGRPPAQAEVDYWQQQAREAAARHFETSEGDTPYVALLKEELAEDAANAYGSMGGADLMDPAPLFAEDDHSQADPTPAQAALPTADEFLTDRRQAARETDQSKLARIPTADEFLDPATPEVKLNVSGQSPARRDWQKRYIVVDPDLGDFRRTVKERKPKGITRATTFNKAAQNTTHLNLWGKANVARGASLRPDILRRAHGLTWEDHRDELLRIVDELETAAGAKVAADEGTFLHEFCDQVDAGLKTWEDAPAAYQQDIKRYVEALANEGLEPVPGLIERTTFIREYGGVAGTFDRIFYHRPSGQYIVGDLKTGKTMSYAMDETECQIWTYAHGVNQTGIYDWNTDTWGAAFHGCECESHLSNEDCRGPRDITVSETVGVIVHMPVQGKEAGEVYLRYADLECGRAYAELNHAVRSYPKSKVRPFEMPSAAPERESWQDIGGGVEVRHSVVDVPAPERPWEAEFRGVRTGEDANALWRQAKAAGIKGERLAALVDLARQSIRLNSWSQRQGLPSSPR